MPGPAERTLFVARHGSRIDFEQPTWIEHAERPYDPELSPRGIHQASQLAARVARETIKLVYSSPYLRAVHTACLCARALHRPLRIEAGFGERLDPAWFSHQPETLSIERLHELFEAVDTSYHSLVEPEFPEHVEEAQQRFRRTMHEVLMRSEGSLLIVGHGATVAGVTAALVPGRFAPTADEASLSRLECRNGHWELVLHNDRPFMAVSDRGPRSSSHRRR